VTVADPAVLSVLRPGDRVDVLAVRPGREAPATLAENALVLSAPGQSDIGGAAVYLAMAPAQARELVAAAPSARFAVLIRR
jgi:hypothetical protein